MKRTSSTLLTSLSLASILASVIFVSSLAGIFPNRNQAALAARLALADAIGLHCTQSISRRDVTMVQESLARAVSRNADLLGAALVEQGGGIVMQVGGVRIDDTEQQAVDLIRLPLYVDDAPFGKVLLGFKPLEPTTLLGVFASPVSRFAMFMAAACGLLFHLYLKRVLRYLDPSRVIPNRVRATLDTLAEGLVVLDDKLQIVLVNQSIARILGQEPDALQGHWLSEFQWQFPLGMQRSCMPWQECIKSGTVVAGCVLELPARDMDVLKFRVTCSPITSEHGLCQGALVSLEDITALEARSIELSSMLEKLKESREQIREQNQQLIALATRDPLTAAFNRRYFFEHLERHWKAAQENGSPLTCIMVDLDHFKRINDNYGHAMGDLVLQKSVERMQSTVRPDDIVGRFSGEEFCILLPHTTVGDALQAAERIRHALEAQDMEGIRVTASLGVAHLCADTADIEGLMERADKALYAAKRTGRNRVVSAIQLEALAAELTLPGAERVADAAISHPAIPFETVAALTAALAYRDVETAQHSRRVADWCFAMGAEMLSLSDSYILENAALLHDIGKIGVPDRVLLKPGALTKDEWRLMRQHDEIGVQIIRSTFACEKLTEIVEHHHASYGGAPEMPDQPRGKEIPLGARILTIADSYDAMVSDRVYRKGMGRDVAFAELRRCAGTQFDPELVEDFIALVDRKSATDETATTRIPGQVADKQSALLLGIQLEYLAQALDEHNAQRLRAIASTIGNTADSYQLGEISIHAHVLSDASSEDADWARVFGLTLELMELCRRTQQSHLCTTTDQHPQRRKTDKSQLSDRSAPPLLANDVTTVASVPV